MKIPTDDEIETAIAWLEAFDGESEPENARDIARVIGWLHEFIFEREIRAKARKAGVPIARVRQRLAELQEQKA